MKRNYGRLFTQRPTVFFLTGGIGNQLFGYAAGTTFAKINDKKVQFDLSSLGKGFTNHNSSILSLNINLQVSPDRSILRQSQTRVMSKFHRMCLRFLRVNLMSSTTYRSDEIGYDSRLLDKRKVKEVHGYFQSWKYVYSAIENFQPGETLLNTPSHWFLTSCKDAAALKPIFVHVRRGDYKQLSELYGLLDIRYYAAAIRIARNFLPNNPIWVVSDDISEAKNLLESLLPSETIWINPPKGADPVESLVLMSQGAGNIIANSTFSWWSAILNKNSVVTLAPEKWFKGMQDPKDLYPPHWLLVESTWQN
jgi:hypothetical protein